MKFFLIFLLFLTSCSKEAAKPKPPLADVTVYTLEPKTLPVTFDFIGFVESSHLVEIRARVEGYLDKIAYEEGQLVEEGDLLFQLDPRQYEAKVAQAQGDVERQKALVVNADLTVDRLAPLYEKKAASKKDLDNAIANQLASKAALTSMEANLLDAEINLSYTKIISPVTGYADRAKLRVGALINPAANSLLTTVSVLDPIWVYFTVSDNGILRVRQEEKDRKIQMPEASHQIALPKDNSYDVELIMSDGSLYAHRGKVNFASPTYDQSTGTMLVRGVFPNPEGYLRPGQFVRVKVYGANRPNALFVPQRALLQKSTGMYVYRINDKGDAVQQDVSTGEWYGEYQVITNGLKTGDKIIVDGVNKIRPGMEINQVGVWSPK